MTFFSPLVGYSATFRFCFIAAALLAAWALYRRPDPKRALLLVVAVNVIAWAAYVFPQERLYGFDVGLDRAFNLGMASATAAGNSPFDHTQVGVAAPEPFWNVVLALASGMDPERTIRVFHWFPVVALLLVAAGFYWGLAGGRRDEQSRWERALTVFALFGLGSLSMSQNPVGVLWVSNMLYKPNHGLAWAVVAVAAGLMARGGRPWWLLGAVLGLLAWVFLLDWAYVLPALMLAALWLRKEAPGIVGRTVAAIAMAVIVAAPFVLHLTRDYAPTSATTASTHMWNDGQGIILSRPYWSTFDMGPLFVLGVAGAACWSRRRSPLDRVLLAMFLSAWATWILATMAFHVMGISPEPDELHFYLRMVVAVAAGAALAAGARHLEEWWHLRSGQGSVLVLMACLPWTFAAYWDAPLMDRYYQYGLTPIHRKVQDYAAWVRANTQPDAIFLAGETPATYIPALTGRRVLYAPTKLVPKDMARRREVAHVLLTFSNPSEIRAAAAAYGVTHIAIDDTLEKEYGPDILERLRNSEAYYGVYNSTEIWIFEIRPAIP